MELYEDFAKSRAKRDVDSTVSGTEEVKSSTHGTTHIFQVKHLTDYIVVNFVVAQSWAQIHTDCHQLGQIWDLFR